MRTRSGSLAAVSARVPSHPAYAGDASRYRQQMQGAIDTPDPGPKPVSNTADGQNALAGIAAGGHIQFSIWF